MPSFLTNVVKKLQLLTYLYHILNLNINQGLGAGQRLRRIPILALTITLLELAKVRAALWRMTIRA